LKLISGGNFTQDGRQKLYDYYYNRFGLGEYTGVELYEVPGHVPAPDEYDYTMDYTYANLTFGQGLNVTMVQVAAAVSSIVNGGFYYEPTVLAGKMVNGEFVPAESKNYVRKTVSETTSNTMRAMLYGTRNSRRLYGIDKAGYYVGGKTGTAQVIQKDGKYSDAMGETIASYVGFGGTEGELPEYLIMVKIWGEGKHLEGERDAMPLFDSISNYLQTYLKIKPKGQ
jgi:cell division protein FtsI/penicillin-binding protein 2